MRRARSRSFKGSPPARRARRPANSSRQSEQVSRWEIIQAEARRYFFLQRISNVDLHNLTFDQDQNVHSLWTFALNVALGYEF